MATVVEEATLKEIIGMKIKQRVKEFLGKVPFWSKVFFIVFLVIVIGGSLLIIYHTPYTLFGGSADSACYLLSALAQSQAAIVAIVVTLTLVAVQLVSQTYSLRVTYSFLKGWIFWLLLLIYGLSIMYDVMLLNMINKENVLSLRCWINGALVLVAFTFSWLFLHIGYTMNKLKPKSIRLVAE